MNLKEKILILLFCLSLQLHAKDWEKVAPTTASNIEGHKNLYKKGFYVITSTEKSLEYFRKNAVEMSHEAWARFVIEISKTHSNAAEELKKNPEIITKAFAIMNEAGRHGHKSVSEGTDKMVREEWEMAKGSFEKSWEGFLLGTLYIKDRTREDFEQIKSTPENLMNDLKTDFSNIKEIVRRIKGEKKREIEEDWGKDFERASLEFQKEYEESGKQSNSLTALPYVIWGGIKSIYFGLFKSGGKVIEKGASKTLKIGGKIVEKGVLLPMTSLVLVSGRTLYSAAGVVFYTGKMGIDIVSPQVESALHAGMGLIMTASTIPTYVFGKSMGIITQVAMTSAGAAGGAGSLVMATAKDSAEYMARMVYSTAKGAGKVVIAGGSSGIVLGYNALSALPVHMVTGAVNGVFFLVYDGPKLAIAYAKGELGFPVGSVVDIEKLKKAGIDYELLGTDEETLKDVIKKLPKDLEQR